MTITAATSYRRGADWRDQAACIGHHQLFDPILLGENTPHGQPGPRHRRALDICYSCPVLVECRTWALRDFPDEGWIGHGGPIVGGLTLPERRRMRRQHGIPKPQPIHLHEWIYRQASGQ